MLADLIWVHNKLCYGGCYFKAWLYAENRISTLGSSVGSLKIHTRLKIHQILLCSEMTPVQHPASSRRPPTPPSSSLRFLTHTFTLFHAGRGGVQHREVAAGGAGEGQGPHRVRAKAEAGPFCPPPNSRFTLCMIGLTLLVFSLSVLLMPASYAKIVRNVRGPQIVMNARGTPSSMAGGHRVSRVPNGRVRCQAPIPAPEASTADPQPTPSTLSPH